MQYDSYKCGVVTAVGLMGVVVGILWGYRWRQEPLYHAGLMLLSLAWYFTYRRASTTWMRSLSLGLCFLSGFTCAGSMVVNAYLMNYQVFFYLGLFLELDLLILYSLAYRPSSLMRMAINTGILGIILLPIVDLATSPPRKLATLHPSQRPYAYETARRDPVNFQLWWDRYLGEWEKVGQGTLMQDPTRKLPFRLKPNGTARMFDSEFNINSLGFRDEEFPREKNGLFRIVALGESTTMGCTLEATDRPWPKVLEQIIRERLHPPRPVQVINAGVWAYSLADNLSRIASDIIPLQPDLIISYHGYNGFSLLDNTLAPVLQADPPRFIARPVFLLARAEHRLRVLFFMRQVNHKNMADNVAKNKLSNPLDSEYARLYGQLVEVARTNQVRLVLANFNLAVNELSHPDIIEFYRLAFPQVHEAIRANEAHSLLLTQLSLKYPEIAVIDVQKNLYGQNSQFIDLVHFTQSGRDQLATNVFDGIQAILKAGLNLPNQ